MPTMIGDAAYFDDALRIVSIALHGRINHTAQTSLANDILCVAAGLRSAALVEQLYLNPNDVERIESMFHHTTRFNHLDLLSIGNDHIFIIHRTLLLHDINEYLSESEQGLHRVFVNIDYLLSQPEILPGRRYEPLDKYLQDHLLPDLQMRIQCWDQAELCHLPLPAPDYVHDQGDSTMTAAEDKDEAMPTSAERDTRAAEDGDFLGLSMVTLSGWLLGYPVNYVLPTTASMKVRKRAAKALKRRKRALNRQRNTAARQLHYQQPRQQGMEGDQVLPAAAPVSHDSADCSTYVDDGNMSDDEGDGDMLTMRGAGRDTQANELDNGDDDEEEENDSSHNSLANRLLVLTQINLSANEAIHGLHDHCLLSFSYPSALLDRYSVPATGVEIASSAQLPSAPASPLWFTGGYEHSTTTSREVNPFETSLLSNSNGSHGAAGSSYSTTMHGALPPTPPSILTTPTAAPVPSSSYPSEPTATTATAAPVVPSIIQSLLSTHLAPPPMYQHCSSHRRRTGSRSRHPFDMTPDSGSDDPLSTSSSSRSPHSHSPHHSLSQSHHNTRRRSSSPTPISGSDIDPVQQYRFYRSQEPLYQHHQQHRLLHPHHHHHHRGENENKEDHDLLPPSHPEICAAGRSLLEVLHARFRRQSVWKTWQVGQQTITLPVVAL